MTKKLYYEDAYRKEFDAVITGVQDGKGKLRILLDQTAFYPEGGGQDADTGTLLLTDGSTWSVVDVHEKEDEVWHYLASESSDAKALEAFVPGAAVHGCIHWERRFDHMQQHSGEHIVSGLICDRFQCNNVGFHMGEDIVTIDYDARISMEEALEIEQAANAYLWENHPFLSLWPTPEELEQLDYRSKKKLEGAVRIAEFPGADRCACCGTHVASSAEVGLVKFLSAKKFHEGTRLELLCGKRAIDFLAKVHAENKEVAVLLSAKDEQTAERVQLLIDENNQLKAAMASLEDTVFPIWAESFRGKGNSLVIEDRLSPKQGRVLADLIADACGGTAAVFIRSAGGYSYALVNRTEELGEAVKELNAALDGRGGGRGGFAQGSVKAGRKEIAAFFDTYFL